MGSYKTNALLFVDHGSRQASANQASEGFVEKLCDRGLHAFIAHMELASPTIEEQIRHIAHQQFKSVTIVPLFFSRGKHMIEDIPTLVDDACRTYDMQYKIEPTVLEDGDFLELMFQRYNER